MHQPGRGVPQDHAAAVAVSPGGRTGPCRRARQAGQLLSHGPACRRTRARQQGSSGGWCSFCGPDAPAGIGLTPASNFSPPPPQAVGPLGGRVAEAVALPDSYSRNGAGSYWGRRRPPRTFGGAVREIAA